MLPLTSILADANATTQPATSGGSAFWSFWTQVILPSITGLVSIITALVVAWVAWQQHKTAKAVAAISQRQHELDRDNLRLALYEKRFDVYTIISQAIGEVYRHKELTDDTYGALLKAREESLFLFGHDVQAYCEPSCSTRGRCLLRRSTIPATPKPNKDIAPGSGIMVRVRDAWSTVHEADRF